jgi:hypothetical protein
MKGDIKDTEFCRTVVDETVSTVLYAGASY